MLKYEVVEIHKRKDISSLIHVTQSRKTGSERKKTLRRITYLFSGIWFFGMGIYGFYTAFFGADSEVPGAWLLFFYSLLLMVGIACFILSGKDNVLLSWIAWKNFQNKGQKLVYRFEEDCFIISAAGEEASLAYTDVDAVWEEREHYFLFIGGGVAHILKKDSFTVGLPEEFRVFVEKRTGKLVEYVKTKA